ncbi:MAG: hypothetical protein LQ345_005035 [Seirophora villosa]|nr:MAG: hypothetical protein LQ345_005035 [Seirophora villosa]
MATVRKYAALPDLDAAPDIYETPELTDDASTAVGSSTIQSGSRASSAAGLDGEESAINRQRIDPKEARSNFLTNEDSERASRGWIGSRRAGYKASGRRIPDGNFQHALADSSDDEDEESLERKLARLRREVAEVKESFARRGKEAKPQDAARRDQDSEPIETLDSLSHVLESIETSPALDQDDPSSLLIKRLDELYQPNASQVTTQPAKGVHERSHTNPEADPALDYGEAHILSRVSDFDKRLRMLETALGMDLIPLPTQDRGASRAVLPTLDGLYRQISTLSMTETSLDKVGRQIRQMTQDSERLVEARKAAAAAARRSSNPLTSERNRLASAKSTADRSTEDKGDLDQASKINALYGTLATIESLSPLLPSVLDRLQSLRVIHADAALASEALSNVESRQGAMAEELKEWKDGLVKVESAMKVGERSMKENTAVVDGWVQDLERRVQMTKSATST